MKLRGGEKSRNLKKKGWGSQNIPACCSVCSWEISWPHNLGYPTSGREIRGSTEGGGQQHVEREWLVSPLLSSTFCSRAKEAARGEGGGGSQVSSFFHPVLTWSGAVLRSLFNLHLLQAAVVHFLLQPPSHPAVLASRAPDRRTRTRTWKKPQKKWPRRRGLDVMRDRRQRLLSDGATGSRSKWSPRNWKQKRCFWLPKEEGGGKSSRILGCCWQTSHCTEQERTPCSF